MAADLTEALRLIEQLRDDEFRSGMHRTREKAKQAQQTANVLRGVDSVEAPSTGVYWKGEHITTTVRLVEIIKAECSKAWDDGHADGVLASQDVQAWQHEDDPTRVISAAQKAQALRDGGASASSVKPYSVPLTLGVTACRTCAGRGWIETVGEGGEPGTQTCPDCNGTGNAGVPPSHGGEHDGS